MEIRGIFYLGLALLTFAFSHITDKLGMESGVDPTVFTFFRILVGLMLVSTVWFSMRKKRDLVFYRKHIKDLAIIGVLASGFLVLLMIIALSYTTATNRGIIQGMYTASTALFAYFMLHERLPRLFYPILGMMVVGLVLLTSNGFLELPNTGDWILIVTIPAVGFLNVFAKKTLDKIHSLTVAFGRYLFGALFLLLVMPFFGIQNIDTLGNGVLWVVLSGLLSATRAIVFYKGIQIVGATLAATSLTLAPVVTAVSAYFILGETLSLLQLLGLVLVVGGALVVIRLKASYKKVEVECGV